MQTNSLKNGMQKSIMLNTDLLLSKVNVIFNKTEQSIETEQLNIWLFSLDLLKHK